MVTLIDNVGVYVALPALLGIVLLLPLYLSQRRDVVRLRTWMERDPDHPQTDVAASEALLDRAETEREASLAERGESLAAAPPGPPTVEAPAPPPAPAAPAPGPERGG